MRILICILAVLMASGLANSQLLAKEPLIKSLDSAALQGEPEIKNLASPLCDDQTFLRRITLDVIGRTPTSTEVRDFLASKEADKRLKAVDRLLSSPDFSWYWAQVLDSWWMERRQGKNVEVAAWMAYLRESLATDKPIDTVITEIVSADGVDPAQRAKARFLLDRDMEPTLVVRDISRLFLGANLQCSQCHDHPRVEAYKQEHFHGLMAYFNRTYLFDDPKLKKKVIGEKADGEVTFQSVFDPKKVTKKRSPGLPGGAEKTDPMVSKDQLYVSAPTKEVRGVPKYSRRLLLGKDLAEAGRRPMARNLANRLWAQLNGKGLVHPLDQIHPDNPADNEPLLESLTDLVIDSRFSLKPLIRQVMLSNAYQRSSVSKHQLKDAEKRLLIARLRPLSPEQMGYAVLSSTGFDEAEIKALGAKATPVALHAKREGAAKPFVGMLAQPAGNPYLFEPRLEQSLFMSNHAQTMALLVARPGNLASRLMEAKGADAMADELYLSMFCRFPDSQERTEIAAALQSGDKASVISDLIWALLTSAEFRFIS
jgi:hypothetical protein